MPKLITAVRHAKSSWKDPGLRDLDRPLNGRGKKAAPAMASKLKELGLKPDLLLSSPARRAYDTARAFAEVFGFKESDILKDPRFYFEGEEAMAESLMELDDQFSSVVFFSHEPVISEFCETWCDWNEFKYPTAAACVVRVEADQWRDIRAPGKQELYLYPKAISTAL